MELKTTGQHSQQELTTGTETRRAVYTPPVLKVYGAVSQLTLGTMGSVGDAGTQSMPMSDRRAKQGIKRVAGSPTGIGLYTFEYRPEFRDRHGHGLQLGVMADEVAALAPGAVITAADGYQRVDYAKLRLHHDSI